MKKQQRFMEIIACLLSNPGIMTDVSRMFNYLEHYKSDNHSLKNCNTIIPSPQIRKKGNV